MTDTAFTQEISRRIWERKYRLQQDGRPAEATPADSWRRVARALAEAEPAGEPRRRWERAFYEALEDFRFLPGGRILAGAGTGRRVTLFNCFVMGELEDSIPSIFDGLRESAVTMQQGGGIGLDFSGLRPRGSRARSSNNISSGPVSFMRIWDTMCETMVSTGPRRGAMMATLRCDHPDIEEFVSAKRGGGALTHFNLSVLITDAFMQAVEGDEPWPLVFPERALRADTSPAPAERLRRDLGGNGELTECRVLQTLPARQLWRTIMESAYACAEPGVLFIDRINRANNLGYCETLRCTNPCGEVPLPAYGACNLGSVNLTRFVRAPFRPEAEMDYEGLERLAATAVRMLDNVVTLSRFPLPQQHAQAQASRRVGLGITGLADALLMLGLRYDRPEAREVAANVMRRLRDTAYRSSIALAREKGPFPLLQAKRYLERPFIRALPAELREGIRQSGIRNSHLLSIAPTGSISLLAGNISSGLEPVFDYRYRRNLLNADGTTTRHEVTDYAYALWLDRQRGGAAAPLPGAFVTATELTPEAHLQMQAALQRFVDNSISKTINVPPSCDFDTFADIYRKAYELELKGCTTFRPNPVTGAVLQRNEGPAQVHCCTLERESD